MLYDNCFKSMNTDHEAPFSKTLEAASHVLSRPFFKSTASYHMAAVKLLQARMVKVLEQVWTKSDKKVAVHH